MVRYRFLLPIFFWAASLELQQLPQYRRSKIEENGKINCMNLLRIIIHNHKTQQNCATILHWNGNVINLAKFSSLVALAVVKMTTASAASNENSVKITIFLLDCYCMSHNVVMALESSGPVSRAPFTAPFLPPNSTSSSSGSGCIRFQMR